MANRPLKLGLAGLGTVGAALARLIAARRDDFAERTGRSLEIVAFSARSPGDRGLPLGGARFHPDAREMAASADIDVLVELIGGASGPAYEAVRAALTRGVHVVTANKAMLAAQGVELAEIAEKSGVALAYEAAVGGRRACDQDAARGAGGQPHPARERHTQRHLQFYSLQDGDGTAIVRRLPE